MSEVKVNKISPRAACGTVTLGDSGDTIALGSGATQTGFGRTGTVDWQTGDIKTSTFTAVNGQGFFVDTNGGAVTSNLPAGSAGAIVSFQDYRNTFDTAALTITPNGSEKINGGAGSLRLITEGEGVTLVYIDSTVGWRSIQDNVFADVGNNYVVATGGTVTTFGDFKVHKFTGPGSFCVSNIGPASSAVDYLIVAGGGGGGTSGGGGGGAGGFRLLTCQPISVTSFPVAVGSGGTKGCCSPGGAGSTTTFKCNSSAGGGGGGKYCQSGVAGGSGGGGGSGCTSPGSYAGGAGNTPATPVSQGNAGGTGSGNPQPTGGGGGGGGAAAVGANYVSAGLGGPGGNGTDISPTFGPGFGDSNFFSGGGGAGAQSNPAYSIPGAPTGGNGGGGVGGGASAPYGGGTGQGGGNGSDNTGGGGGGSGNGGSPSPVAGIGGSGIVLIRYKFQN